MEPLRERIERMNAEELSELLGLVLSRYQVLFPGWELNVISLEKGRDREEQLDGIIRLLSRMKQETQGR